MTMSLEIPPPLPDELVYSALARAKYRMGWPTTRFAQRLFAGRTIIVRPHFCGQLDLVANTMSEVAGWPYSAEHLRDHHTLFPVISPLLDGHQWPKCTAALHGDRVSRTHVGLCRQILGVTPFTRLKTCPTCRRTDRRDYGEAYLHGIHQPPGICVCAHDGTVLQECPVTAEPDFYTALDEVTEFRRLRVASQQLDMQLRMASSLFELMRAPEKPGSVADFLPLIRRLASHGTSPVFEMLSLSAAGRAPLRLVVDPAWAGAGTVSRKEYTTTDERWLRLAQRFLPQRVRELASTYRRRIAWLTLRRELESHARARLPAWTLIPRTAALVSTLIETKAQASRRLEGPQVRDEAEIAA